MKAWNSRLNTVRGGGKPKPKKAGFKLKRTEADRLFSIYIRARADWTCERCGRIFYGSRRFLDCSHFFSRSNRSTRFDPRNAASLCRSCHQLFTMDAGKHLAFFSQRLGAEKLAALRRDAMTPRKINEADIVELYEKKLTEMGVVF